MTVPCARYYEEGEYERKVRKRRARLLTTAEESFTHIKRMRQEHTGNKPRSRLNIFQSTF